MHVLLPTIGSVGDLFPMLGIGRALLARGHQATVVASPIHEAMTRAAGLAFEPLGTREQTERLLANPDLWHPLRGFELVAREGIVPATRALYDCIARYDSAETVVAAHSMAFGALLAREALGTPVAALHLQPTMLRSRLAPARMGVPIPAWSPLWFKEWWYRYLDREIIDAALAAPINALRAELGLAPVTRLFDGWIHQVDQLIGLFPDWYAPIQPDWPRPLALVGFPLYELGQEEPLPPAVQRFLAAGEAPLLVTFGTGMGHGARYFRAAIEGAQRLGRRLIVATRLREQLPAPLPAGVLHVPFVPFQRLMPHVAALIHHGGIGTLAQGVAAGVPQLVMPLSHDQPDNAARLERLGLGRTLMPQRFSARAVARTLGALLDSAEGERRRRQLARQVDGAAAIEAAVTLIEGVARR